jgi:hypothetical protein
MRRMLPTLFLLLAAAPVGAEWVKVGENQGAVIYVDPTTLVHGEKYLGGFRRAWSMEDIKWPRSDGVASFRTLDDFDCKDKRRRTVFRVAYSGPMATGKVLDSGQLMIINFEIVYPYSPGAYQLEYVCGL